MKRITTILLLLQASLTASSFFRDDTCLVDNRSLLNMWEYKIFHDRLKCGYDPSSPPPQNNSEPLQVNVSLALKKFRFYSDAQEFSAITYVVFEWNDYRLKWNPSDYDGLKHIELTNIYLWSPSIKLLNPINDDYNAMYKYYYATCTVKHQGNVICVTKIVFEAHCKTDLRDWPYDAQECKLEMGANVEEKGYKIKLEFGTRAMTMLTADYGTEWDIMDYKQNTTTDSERQLSLTLRLERHAEVLTCIVIYPTLIISALTLSVLFVDFRSKIRLLVACFSLLCHFYCLPQFSDSIPEHSDNPPLILLYFRGSLIMTKILVILSFTLYHLGNLKQTCPNWLILFNEFVYKSCARFLIWPRWNNEDQKDDINSDSKCVKEWIDFANIVNSVWIIAFVIVYISLYVAFVPHPITINY